MERNAGEFNLEVSGRSTVRATDTEHFFYPISFNFLRARLA